MKKPMTKTMIEQLIGTFKNYLTAKAYTPKTIAGYFRILRYYLTWLSENRLDYLGVKYENLLAFIKQERDKGLKVKSINQKLYLLRKFYTSLLIIYPDDAIILGTGKFCELLK